jgi:hypothetical protein
LQRWTVVAFHSWTKAYHKVKAVFPQNSTILFQTHARFGYGMYEYCSKERWYIENIPELPLQAGSGTWKASATELLYAPMPGEDLHGQTVVEIPVLGTLINVYAANVSINNIVVENTAGERNH